MKRVDLDGTQAVFNGSITKLKGRQQLVTLTLADLINNVKGGNVAHITRGSLIGKS